MALKDSVRQQLRELSKDEAAFQQIVALFEAQKTIEPRHDLILNNVKDVIFQIDTEDNWVYLSPSWEEITGFRVAETIGRPFTDFIHPDDHHLTRAMYRGLVEKKTDDSHQRLRYLHKTGDYRRFEVHARLATDDVREVSGAVGVLRDITDRERIEAALAQSEARYRQIFNSSQAVKLLINPRTGRIIEANDAAVRFYGYSREALQQMHIHDINTLPDEMVNREIERVRAGERTFYKFQHRTASGELRDVDVFASMVIVQEEQLIYSIIVDVTGKREAELRYQALFEQSNDAVFILDLEGNHIQVNKRASEMLGYTRDELTNISFREIVVSEQHHQSENVLQRLLDGESVPPYERIFRRKDGGLLPTEINVEMVYDDQGRPLHIQSVVRDITERKEMELANQAFLEDIKALQTIHMELSAVDTIDNLYHRMVELTQERLGIDRIGVFRATKNSKEWYGTYGTDEKGNIRSEKHYRGDITDDHWTLGILNAHNHALMWDEAATLEETGEVRQIWKVASALWNGERALGYIFCDNLVSGRAPRPYEQELVSILGSTFGHIIDRKESEEALRESEERYRTVVATMVEGVVLYGGDGSFQASNPAVEQILGVSQDDMAVYSHSNLSQHVIHEDGSPFMPEDHPLTLTLKTGLPHTNIVMGIYKSDGELSWVSVNAKPIYYRSKSGDGPPDAVLATFVDITELKRAQQRELELTLERERVGMLTTFIQNAAHEFRTPLSTINSNAYLMARSDEPESRGMRLEQVKNQVGRITGLVDMLLTMVKLESRSSLACSPVNIKLMMNDLCRSLSLAHSSQRQIHFEQEADIPLVLGDDDYLVDAFRQILDNAIRFIPPDGAVNVTIGTAEDMVWLDIQDTGPGISEAALPNIFETFWRQDQAHSTPGFGLGLPIARKIIELHGGRISVDSTIGAGTCFHITLPAYNP